MAQQLEKALYLSTMRMKTIKRRGIVAILTMQKIRNLSFNYFQMSALKLIALLVLIALSMGLKYGIYK